MQQDNLSLLKPCYSKVFKMSQTHIVLLTKTWVAICNFIRRNSKKKMMHMNTNLHTIHELTSCELGLRAYWMLHSPTTPRCRMTLRAVARRRLYSVLVRVWLGATTMDSPVWIPRGSTFSMLHTCWTQTSPVLTDANFGSPHKILHRLVIGDLSVKIRQKVTDWQHQNSMPKHLMARCTHTHTSHMRNRQANGSRYHNAVTTLISTTHLMLHFFPHTQSCDTGYHSCIWRKATHNHVTLAITLVYKEKPHAAIKGIMPNSTSLYKHPDTPTHTWQMDT